MQNETNVLERQRGKIRARVLSDKDGLREYEGVRAIRIHSQDYNLLMMEDYAPTLGKICGDVHILTRDTEEHLTGVNGFYKLQQNLFVLILDDAAREEEKA